MQAEYRTLGHLTAHAACAAAGVRDGLRTAQFYARDMRSADGGQVGAAPDATFLSRGVAALARGFDASMSRIADLSVRAFMPSWRVLPSPFQSETRTRVIASMQSGEATLNSEFTAYFFRAAREIAGRWAAPPCLILEHRIEAVRRNFLLSPESFSEADALLLGKVLLRLVEARPIARLGKFAKPFSFAQGTDPNIPVMAAACLALLLAKEGKPIEGMGEGDFLAVSAVLISAHLPALIDALAMRDEAAIAGVLDTVREQY